MMSFNKFLNETETNLNSLQENICDIRIAIVDMQRQLKNFAEYLRGIPLEDTKLEKDRQM